MTPAVKDQLTEHIQSLRSTNTNPELLQACDTLLAILELPWDHHLYRMFDLVGTLLYIGESHNAAERHDEHRADKVWESEIAKIEIQRLPKCCAKPVERAAIKRENPKYNIAHSVVATNLPTGMDEVLHMFQGGVTATLQDVIEATGLSYGRASTILSDLKRRGILMRAGDRQWRLVAPVTPPKRKGGWPKGRPRKVGNVLLYPNYKIQKTS